MGQRPSKPNANYQYVSSSSNAANDDELVTKLQSMLSDSPLGGDIPQSTPIVNDNLLDWSEEILADPTKKLAMNCFTGNDITKIIANTSNLNTDNIDIFNYNVKFEGGPITNQKSSGRCWLFASTNVFKEIIKSQFNLDSFEFSQNYLFFYDKLEKCNWFLNRILECSDDDIESRLVQFLFQLPENDGGQWDMVVNLVNKYGLVPKSIYKDSASSINSGPLNYLINNKLREYALVLRKLKAKEKDLEEKGVQPINDYAQVKEQMIKEIHNILSLTLGIPPKADDSFVWEYKDKFGTFHQMESTPLKFYKEVLNFDADEHFSLIHDPRNDEGLYTVDKLGNIEDGKQIEYVNTSIDELKQAAINMIKSNTPVFFGSDVGKFCDRDVGLLDVDAWDYNLGFGLQMNLNKRQRLQTGSSQMTHAMVLTGVHIINGKPVRWKVENSWGEYGEHKGYFIMTDRWFDEYVLQVVTNAGYVPKRLTQIWKSKQFKVLPYYDPMGALA